MADAKAGDKTPEEFRGFLPHLANPVPVSDHDLAKWHDFLVDADALGPDLKGLATGSWLGRCYRLFVRMMSPRERNPPPQLPAPTRPPAILVPELRRESDRFGRLATIYGDRYRGSVVVNYVLGCVAMTLAAIPLVVHDMGELTHYIFASFEVAVICVILVVHWRGRSGENFEFAGLATERPAAGRRRRWKQRWHERWLDYRGLAECFRYSELLGALRGRSEGLTAQSGDLARRSGDDWATRYFHWRIAGIFWPAASSIDYAANLLVATHQQQLYHLGNARQCGGMSRRLHQGIVSLFLLALAVGGVALLASLVCALVAWLAVPSWQAIGESFLRSWEWKVTSVIAPTFAAALHGIQASFEYTKLGKTSHEMARELTALRAEVERLVYVDPASGSTQAALERAITRFLRLTTEETTGWRATLWDKNVPLP